jgi:hypothetical protein
MNYWAVGQNPFWSTNAMQITVVAVMCHTLGAFFLAAVGTRPDPVCREHAGLQLGELEPHM